MLPEWKVFLEQAGATIEQGAVMHFGRPDHELAAALNSTVLSDLSHLGLLAASGADAQTFLQNQFTNDVRRIDEQHSQLNAYCSPKGRVLALFRLFKRQDSYYLCLPQPLLAGTLQRLRLFVLRAQVTLADASTALVPIGLAGPEAEALLIKIAGAAPPLVDDCRQLPFAGGTLTIMRIPGPQARFAIAGEAAAMMALWPLLQAHAAPVGAAPWALLDIRSGIPSIHGATVDAFVPQMLNLQAIDAVSFKKGCYPGQEIVARMQYLGTLKRRMYYARIDTATRPEPGDDLYSPADEQGIGQVVDAQPSPQGGFEMLAVIQIAHAKEGMVRLSSRQGPPLQFNELPYTLAT